MTAVLSDQAHLNADVLALTDAFATVLAKLKNQSGSGALDFTEADALVQTVQAAAGGAVPVMAETDPPSPVGADGVPVLVTTGENQDDDDDDLPGTPDPTV